MDEDKAKTAEEEAKKAAKKEKKQERKQKREDDLRKVWEAEKILEEREAQQQNEKRARTIKLERELRNIDTMPYGKWNQMRPYDREWYEWRQWAIKEELRGHTPATWREWQKMDGMVRASHLHWFG